MCESSKSYGAFPSVNHGIVAAAGWHQNIMNLFNNATCTFGEHVQTSPVEPFRSLTIIPTSIIHIRSAAIYNIIYICTMHIISSVQITCLYRTLNTDHADLQHTILNTQFVPITLRYHVQIMQTPPRPTQRHTFIIAAATAVAHLKCYFHRYQPQ